MRKKQLFAKIRLALRLTLVYALVSVIFNCPVSANSLAPTGVLDPSLSISVEHVTLSKAILIDDVSDLKTQKTVSGIVQDETGTGLPGATVLIKGTSVSAVTDKNGAFDLKVTTMEAVLVVSFLGYETQEVAVNGRTKINIRLVPSEALLKDVVVVGYGTQKKKAVTGSVARADLSQIQNSPATNITQALRGTVAGVQVLDNGRPGQGGSIIIRGQRSIRAGNDALVVLDGIIYPGSFSDINPADVESVDILKDAASAAVYGSRAANGVILITTKKGKTDKPSISANAYYGMNSYGHKLKLLSPAKYIQNLLDYQAQNGVIVDPAKVVDYLQPLEKDNYLAGRTIDPYDVVSQDAPIKSVQLSLSARTDRLNYYVSGDLTDEKGLILGESAKRLSGRVNLEGRANDWLKLGLNAQFTHRDLSGNAADFTQAYFMSPYATLYFEDGSLRSNLLGGGASLKNPIFDASRQTNDQKTANLFTNFYGVVNLPFIKGLTFTSRFSPNIRWEHNYNFEPSYIGEGTINNGSAFKQNSQGTDWNFQNQLDYSKRFGNVHALDLTLLYERSHRDFENTQINVSNFFSNALGFNNLAIASTAVPSSSASKQDGLSAMARLKYGLLDRYFFEFIVRRDGASVFSPGNKFGTFPGASFAWVASDEAFLKDNPVLNMLKLKLSYGTVGNQAIGPYGSIARLQNTWAGGGQIQYVFGDGGPTSTGIYPVNIVTPLKWESTTSLNATVEFELFKGRIGATAEVYDSDTKDLLLDKNISQVTGFSSILTNIGSTNNKGFELSLNTINVNSKKFKWNSSFVYSTNRNKIVSLTGRDANNDGVEDDDLANNFFIGQPISIHYNYTFDGIHQVDNPATGDKAGDVRLKDLDGDGKITPTGDRSIIGQAQPKHRFGFTNNFSYGNLSLGVTLTALTGWIANDVHLNPQFNHGYSTLVMNSVNFLDAGYWTKENQSNTRPSLIYQNRYGHGFYKSRDYLRIQNVSLGYTFSKSLLDKSKTGISFAKVYVSGRNLATFTNWLGFDPESGSDAFPMPRIISAGLNLGF